MPTVEHELDTQNFEHFDEDRLDHQQEGAAASGLGRGNRWLAKADPNFIGYTYKSWDVVDQTSKPIVHFRRSYAPNWCPAHAACAMLLRAIRCIHPS